MKVIQETACPCVYVDVLHGDLRANQSLYQRLTQQGLVQRPTSNCNKEGSLGRDQTFNYTLVVARQNAGGRPKFLLTNPTRSIYIQRVLVSSQQTRWPYLTPANRVTVFYSSKQGGCTWLQQTWWLYLSPANRVTSLDEISSSDGILHSDAIFQPGGIFLMLSPI